MYKYYGSKDTKDFTCCDFINDQEKFNAYNNAGFKAKNTKVASAAICRLLKKVNCLAYLEALKNEKDSELQRRNKITRTTQLNALEDARRKIEAEELKELERLSRQRTAELSQAGTKVVKMPSA